jgi:hypothetical protein
MEASATQFLPSQLATIKEFGNRQDPYWYPSCEEDGTLNLDNGERLLWSGSLTRLEVPGAPRMESGSLFATDRRVAFASLAFDKGNTYIGLGMVGFAVSQGATLISKANAKK